MTSRFKRICLLVLDSVGIGELPDAAQYGDEGAHTLGHIAERVPSLQLPHLLRLGLGHIAALHGLPAVGKPQAYYGKMAESSAGKDTMTGHWELMGLQTEVPLRTFPAGFPRELLDRFVSLTGRTVIGNKPASGTEIIAELGREQMETGAWIVYTSADSVLQIAAHEQVIPLAELYRGCEIARSLTLNDPYALGRVIARPYIGEPGAFVRTANRKDYALKPPGRTVMNELKDAGLDCRAIGKISDIYSGEGVTFSMPTKNNEDGIAATIAELQGDFTGLLFTNLVDFDSLYGHRRDPQGYARALEQFDRSLPDIAACIGERDLLIITADHGNDPTFVGTDHTREYVPLLVYSPAFTGQSSLGIRATFADVAAAIAENFGVGGAGAGTSFLGQLQ